MPVDATARGQTETIAFEFDLAHPTERVWRALTDPALVAEWLLPAAGLTPRPGTAFTLHAPPQPGWDGTVRCRVLAVEEERALSYTWVVGDREIDTVVTFTLTPTASGTRLTLEHAGFEPGQRQAFGGARYGWRLMGDRLVDLLARTP